MRIRILFFYLFLSAGNLVAQGNTLAYSIDEVDDPPHFPYDTAGCNESESACAASALSSFLSENLRYPAAAFQSKLAGMATFEVIVEESGRLSKVHLLEEPGKGIGREARRLIYLMNRMSDLWEPGKVDGKPVRTLITIPVAFSLGNVKKEDVAPWLPLPPPPPPPSSRNDIYRVSEVMPDFPYLPKDCPDDDRMFCGPEALLMYLRENVIYPAEALKSSVEGKAIISFVVEHDGQLTRLSIKENPGKGTGEEALRVVQRMNEMNMRWLAGSQGGRTVRVMYNLPVTFKLGVTKEG